MSQVQLPAEFPEKVIYTAKTHTTGGRNRGVSRSSDGRLDVTLSPPSSPHGGTNPEQLFAAGFSACFESAMAVAARRRNIVLPDVAIDTEIDLHRVRSDDYFLSVRLNISLPDLERKVAGELVADTEEICPYSKAIRGNVDVVVTLV